MIVAVKRSAAALNLLRSGNKQSVTRTITAAVPHGSSTFKLTISNVKLKKLRG